MTKSNETGYEEMVRKGELDPEKIMQYHIDNFNQGGGEKPVKVMPTEAMDREHISGFFTQQKFIIGSTPEDMEHLLGLKSGELKNGAAIYELTEIPKMGQFVPAGYTHLPGGRPYEEGSEYPPGDGVKQFRLNEPVPAKVIGKVGYEEPWKGPSSVQNQSGVSSALSTDSSNEPSNEEISESVGELAGNVAAGPAGGEVGKVAGEAAGKTQEMAVESTGQSIEDPVKKNEGAAKDVTTDEEQSYGYGYGY